MKKVNLRNIFINLQKQIITKLITDKTIIEHPSIKGDASELNWIDMLNARGTVVPAQ